MVSIPSTYKLYDALDSPEIVNVIEEIFKGDCEKGIRTGGVGARVSTTIFVYEEGMLLFPAKSVRDT
jgi:hypothetical protein